MEQINRACMIHVTKSIKLLVVLASTFGWTCQSLGQTALSDASLQARSLSTLTQSSEFQIQDDDPPLANSVGASLNLQDEDVPATPQTKPPASAQQGPQPLLLLQTDRLKVIGHFQAGVNGIAEGNVFWNLAEFAAPSVDFDSDPEWLEAYTKPGISFERTGDNGFGTYGKFSAVMSGTLEIDAFDQGNTGRTTIEEGFLGLRSKRTSDDSDWDVSFGPRELKLGTGMLVANGGQNGFERGALKFGPRRAWEFAGIAKLRRKQLATTLFYLDANELASNDTETTLSGIDVRIDRPSNDYLGTTFIYVPTSESPYPKASPIGSGPPEILPGAREGLNAVNSYVRVTPLSRFPDIFLTADFAYQHNDRIDLEAWGGRIQAGKTLGWLPFKPKLVYSFQTFSGDNPNTTKLERFDPLYFEGSPSSWSTGSKSALVFINSNVNSHQLALTVNATKKDTFIWRYAHVRANELFSPIQFGQATRIELDNGLSTVIAGVADPHLSDDFFLEYNRIINANTFLNAGFSISLPGTGIELVAPGNTPVWPGGFMNVVVNY